MHLKDIKSIFMIAFSYCRKVHELNPSDPLVENEVFLFYFLIVL